MGEWTLVLFTLFAQASVGLMAVNQFLNSRNRFAMPKVMVWVGGLMAVALAISFFHLGSPFGGYRALTNLTTSWLSREVFFASLYIGLVAATFFLGRQAAGEGIIRAAGWAAVVAGALTVVSMASIYTNSAVPAWGTFYTHLSFYATAVTLGCFGYAALLWNHPGQQEKPSISTALAFGSGAAGLQLVGLGVYLAVLASGEAAAQQSVRMLANAWPLLTAGQLFVLGGLAAGFRFWQGYRRGPASGGLLYGAVSALVLAALIGRYLFYASGMLPMGSIQ